MQAPARLPIGGYVLAGGHSSRMGQEKALLVLAGKPLIQHTVEKLAGICDYVRILSRNPALASFAPLVEDLHPDTGPIGGIEAALLDSPYDWNLILPVDVPFLPSTLLAWWTGRAAHLQSEGVRIALFRVDGFPQPTILLVHRTIAPYLSQAIARGTYKLFPVLQYAARDLAPGADLSTSLGIDELALNLETPEAEASTEQIGILEAVTAAQRAHSNLWFANLNSPVDFAEAERHLDLLQI